MRYRLPAVLLPVLLALATPGIAVAQPPLASSAAASAVRGALEAWRSAFNARDIARVCDVFAPTLQYDAGPIRDGTYSRICEQLRHRLAHPEPKLHYTLDRIKDILVAGELAIVRLDWTLTARPAQGAPETVHEAGMDVFGRQPDGSWKIVRFMAYDPGSQVQQEGGGTLP